MVLATAARTRWERAEVPWSRSRASAGSAGVSELVAMRAAPSPYREVTAITLRAVRWFRKRTARSARRKAFPAGARRERASGGGQGGLLGPVLQIICAATAAGVTEVSQRI